ncbi:MAG: ArnT family glycosyltransferase [Caulobacterales bacterium]
MSAPSSASGSPAAAGRVSPRAALTAIILVGLLVRLAAGASAPLTEDEAYYRLWSMRPAFGYFDHPPMIAWKIWLGRHIAGDNPLGVRLIPIVGTAVTTLITFDLARLAGLGERVAVRAALWLNATVLIGLGGFLAVPDAPNTLFFTAALWCVFKARQGAGAWWLAAGALAGLACLSKYSALFLAPGILLWLSLTREGRRTLTTPWPWLAAAIAVAVFAPNIAWNAEHHWLTFAKQFGRARVGGLALQHLPELIVDQFLLINPLIAVFLGAAVLRRTAWPLLAVSAPFAAYLVVHSLHDAVQGQWPAPLYPALVIAAAAAAEDVRAGGVLARLRTLAPVLGLGVVAAAFTVILAPLDGRLPFPDPAARLRGWPAFGEAIEHARMGAGAAWVGTESYGLAAQLAAEPPLRAPAVEIGERGRYSFETDVNRADFAKPGLIIDEPRKLNAAGLQHCFARVQALPEIDRGTGSRTPYRVYRVAGPLRDIAREGC